MLKKKIAAALNQQINEEFFSAYLYLSMSAHFESKNLSGMANWMRKQAKEELDHGIKIYNHVVERGGVVTLKQIGVPTATWKSATSVFEHAYNHEKKVTALIHKLVELARSEKDYATDEFLQWFVKEQVEEEDSTSKVWEQLKMIKESSNGLLMLDHALGKRE